MSKGVRSCGRGGNMPQGLWEYGMGTDGDIWLFTPTALTRNLLRAKD